MTMKEKERKTNENRKLGRYFSISKMQEQKKNKTRHAYREEEEKKKRDQRRKERENYSFRRVSVLAFFPLFWFRF
jgi:hypothetical protein